VERLSRVIFASCRIQLADRRSDWGPVERRRRGGARPGGSYGSRDYWLARLVRDNRIELLTAVRSGSLSAYGAAVLAGYRKRTRRKKRSSLAAVEALIG